jgi:hypothetical protein
MKLLLTLITVALLYQQPKGNRYFYAVVDTGKCRCSGTYTVSDGGFLNEKLTLKDCDGCDGIKQITFLYEFKSYEDYKNFKK